MLQPLSVDEVRRLTYDHCAGDHAVNYTCRWCRLILSWVHAEARAREGDWGKSPRLPSRDRLLEIVLDEIAWPKEDR